MNQSPTENRDLVLAPGSYAYVQAENNGAIKTHVGPAVVTLSGQDKPVRYDPNSRKFPRVHQDEAVMTNIAAEEGAYVILDNPASGADEHPEEGGARATPQSGLQMGNRVIIPGPCNFALWPGQNAATLAGHHLSSNEFLIVRVYNEEEARKNWTTGTVAQKTEEDSNEKDGKDENGDTILRKDKDKDKGKGEAKQESLSFINPENLRRGQRIIVRGDQVSFYIPPTGVEVTKNEDEARQDRYVREAVTLERLEYCEIVDENGDKRYERGPAVVFPTPTEHFVTKNKARKFRAIELTARSGLHIKVIHDYEDDDRHHAAGDELFITGAEQAIYFPRVEHAIIKYGERNQHFATAIPRGEGRYVMYRDTGVIETIKGPAMLLPDPRTKVVVRRILSEKEVELWYPGNEEAIAYNRDLQETLDAATESLVMGASAGADENDEGYRDLVSEELYGSARSRFRSERPRAKRQDAKVGKGMAGDEFARGDKFTPPRTLTLDTKYEGVAAISPFVGYAVMTTTKDGMRNVHQGPCTILLAYDETLEVMSISTGKPKNTDTLKRTVYLRVSNNKVSDVIRVETRDHVSVDIKISLLVNFEGADPELWFQAENYVKLLCDHVRSVLKGAVQKLTIEDVYANHVAVVRDSILGESVATGEGTTVGRPGMSFKENGMVVRDVEVLGFDIQNREVHALLSGAQLDAVRNNIELQQAQKQLDRNIRQEDIIRQTADAKSKTRMHGLAITAAETDKTLVVNLAKLQADEQEASQKTLSNESWEEAKNVEHNWRQKREQEIHAQKHGIDAKKLELFKSELEAEVDAQVKRFSAGQAGFSESLLALNRDDVMMKIAEATSIQSMIGGKSFLDVFQGIFKGTPLEKLGTMIAMHPEHAHHQEDE